tara:strand:+ start:935 stop:1303 length:369 start_codon:yes stop_codon:yes gene_type:complete
MSILHKYSTQEALNKQLHLTTTSIASKESVDTYADWTGSIVDTGYSGGHISFVYTVAANTLDVKFLASIDGTTYVEVVGEASKAAGTHTNTFENAPYRYYKVQFKANSGGSQGTIVGHSAVR